MTDFTFPPQATNSAGGGSSAAPQLIDALADASGNPPAGYAWLPGMASVPNFGCALTDYATTLSGPQQVPCQNGFIGYQAFTPAFGFLTWTMTRSLTNETFSANLVTPAGLKAAVPVSGHILSDTSFFYVFKGQLADNSWALFSGVLDSAGTASLQNSVVIPTTYDSLCVPSALAIMGGYYVYPITGLRYVFIEIASGVASPTALLDYNPNPLPRGLIIASDANGIYVQRYGQPAIAYVSMSVSKIDGLPVLVEGSSTTVMPIPGGSLFSLVAPYVPVGACTLPNGNLLLCTRAGFYEVRAVVSSGAVTITVRQTAGVHPLVSIAATAMNATTDDVRWARYNVPLGLVHLMSARHKIIVDYTTLKTLFVRKARLIA